MTPLQFRMARAALRLTIEEVANESSVSLTTVHRIEHDDEGPGKTRDSTRKRLTDYYTGKGILFVDGQARGVLVIQINDHDR